MDEMLNPENMIRLYAQGAFPMADEQGQIDWYFPEIRTIIPLDDFNIPRSLISFMKNCEFTFQFDKDTMEIIKRCSNREETWISDELIEAYERLCEQGFVHSVSVYLNEKLVGGLYGISLKGMFFGESMFSDVSQASKYAMAILLNHLQQKQFIAVDVQYQTEHLKMFGAREVLLGDYIDYLTKAYMVDTEF